MMGWFQRFKFRIEVTSAIEELGRARDLAVKGGHPPAAIEQFETAVRAIGTAAIRLMGPD